MDKLLSLKVFCLVAEQKSFVAAAERLALSATMVSKHIQEQRIPAPPMAIATAPAYDRAVDDIVAAEVAQELIGRVAGKRVVSMVAKRVPLVGGVVGAGADGWMTYQIGRYASRELLPKRSDR